MLTKVTALLTFPTASRTGAKRLPHLRDARCQARLQTLVQRIEHGTVRRRLSADGGDGLGRLFHFRPARRDEFVHAPHSSVDHADALLDNAKAFQRDVARFATNEPGAEDADRLSK